MRALQLAGGGRGAGGGGQRGRQAGSAGVQPRAGSCGRGGCAHRTCVQGDCRLTSTRCLCCVWCRLQRLPLYSLGVSSGASFALKMPRFLKFAGVLSEALGLDPKTWGYDEVAGGERAQGVFAMQTHVGAGGCMQGDMSSGAGGSKGSHPAPACSTAP